MSELGMNIPLNNITFPEFHKSSEKSELSEKSEKSELSEKSKLSEKSELSELSEKSKLSEKSHKKTTIMNYNEIINHPHHVSTKHPQMSMLNRATQFAPFSALTGYEEAIKKKGETFK